MKSNLLALLLLFSANQLMAQEDVNYKYDIGIQYGLNPVQGDLSKFGINFRNELNDKFHLKYALTYNETVLDDRQSKELIYESGTDIILRTQGEFQRHFAGRFGTDYDPVEYLRLGVEVIFGYGSGNSYIVDENEDPNYENGLDHIYDYNNTSRPDVSADQTAPSQQYVQFVDANHYLSTGLSVQIGAYVPFLKRWQIGVSYSPELVRYNLLNTESRSIVVGPYMEDFTSFNAVNHFINFDLKFQF